jgi:hypothetical protein
MALKDLKSDLSKFRMPKNEPLVDKKIDSVNTKTNQTPLSSMVDSAPKIPRSTTTTNKEGVNPQKMDNSSKFLGETTPSKMNNTSNFLGETTPQKVDNSSNFLGETTPQKVDNSSKFLGETTPTPSDKQSQFLGETTPNKADISSKFLGETTPNKADISSKFLGETDPNRFDNSSNFLGETDPNRFDNSSNFLGETDPNRFDNSSNFLGETDPNRFDNSSNFLGETDPNRFDNSSNFLGETTPSPANNESRFLGETTPSPANNESRFLGETTPSPANNESRFLGETTPTLSDRESNFLGETTPTPFSNTSNFLGETTPTPSNKESNFLGETDPTKFEFNPNHSDNGVTPTNVNYFQDIHAKGFTSNFGGVDDTKFIGVNPNNTVFNSTNSRYSNIDDSTFTLGRTYEQSFDSAGRLNSGDTGFGIGKGQAKRNSPSFLDRMYDKFNLKADSFNNGLGLFRHPLILRGIQRKGIGKGEPQLWGIGRSSFDDGLIRGGVVTSTTRALVDVARVGGWLASVEGVLWSTKQVGLQRTNKFGKIWTPANMLAAVGGQHTGLKPMRAGLIPFNDETVKYGNIINGLITAETTGGFLAKKAASLVVNVDTLSIIWDKLDKYNNIDGWRSDTRGGFNSLYGINTTGPTTDRRYVNSRISDTQKFKIIAQYNPIANDPSKNPTNIPTTSTEFNRDKTTLGESIGPANDVSKPKYFDEIYKNSVKPIVGDKNFKHDIYGKLYNEESPYRFSDTTNPSGSLKEFADNTKIGTSIKPYTEYKPIRNPSDKNEDSNDRTGNNRAGAIYSDEYTYEENREDLEGNDLAIIRDVVADTTDINVNLNTTDTHTTYGNPFSKQINELGGIHDLNVNTTSGEIVRRYETIAYGNIPNRIAGDIQINDFRNLLTGKEKERANREDYGTNNINKRVNFGNSGQIPTSDNDRIEWFKTAKEGDRYDKVNASEIGEEFNDLVHLWFRAEGGSKVQFRGTVKGITDTFSPSWDAIKYNGRADQAYKYTTFERSLSFNFQVYATSRIEMKPIWKKLQYLSTMTMPSYKGGAGYQGTLVNFRLGNLYNDKLAFIENLSYTMSDEIPWEISMLGSEEFIGELPMGIDVSIGLKILGGVRPELGKKVYDWGF